MVNIKFLIFLCATACTATPCNPTVVQKDVVVIGAGMAGLTAGKRFREVDPNISFVILERQGPERVGGRVRSNREWFSDVIVEEGANWLNSQTTPLALAETYRVDMFYQDFGDFNVYEYDPDTPLTNRAHLVEERKIAEAAQYFFNVGFNCLHKEGNKLYKLQGKPRYDPKTDGAVAVLNKFCRWEERPEVGIGNLDWFEKWYNLDFTFAEADTSMYSYPTRKYAISKFYFVMDQELGFQKLPISFANQFLGGTGSSYFMFNQNVTKVSYSINDPIYKTAVETNPDTSGCPKYRFEAKRVISTLPVGVLSSGDVTFSPNLEYFDSPFNMANYIKVFYRFPDKFWEALDDREFIVILKQVQNDGICHHWQSLDFPGIVLGSKILFCSLMNDALLELLGGDLTLDLTDMQLKGIMLDPLRRAFGVNLVDRMVNHKDFEYHYSAFWLNRNFYGSYENWKVGPDLKDYYRYFGGNLAGSAPVVPTCKQDTSAHNGCSSSGDWTLHISGSASCRTQIGFVSGAILGGERSANYVLSDIGCNGNGCNVPLKTECDNLFINNGKGQRDL